jgi:hypothetical protein
MATALRRIALRASPAVRMASTASSKSTRPVFDWEDPLDLKSLLTEEETMVMVSPQIETQLWRKPAIRPRSMRIVEHLYGQRGYTPSCMGHLRD